MELIIKVYDSYWSNVEKFNFFTKEKVVIEEELESFDTAIFKVKGYELIEYNKIEIYEVGNPDTLIFRGLVYTPSKQITILKNDTTINCRSERNIMSQRKVLVPRDKSATVESIIQELLGDYPMEQWTTSIGFNDSINLDYKEGDTYESILDEIALQVGGFWDVKNGVLIMDYSLGEDKTDGSNKIDAVFTRSQGDNIKEVNITGQSTRANIVMVYDGTTNVKAEDLSSGIVYGVVNEKFRPGDLQIKANKLLKKLNQRQRLLNVILDPNNPIDANIGDKLNIEISNVNDLEDINGQVLVTKKKITYNLARKKIEIQVGENIVKEDSLGAIITGMKKELDMIV